MGVRVTSHPKCIYVMKKFLILVLWGVFCFNVGDVKANDEVLKDWLKLLYYEKVNDGYQSIIENEDFFIAIDGRVNPKKEYDASIREFKINKNKKCEKPARFLYLRKEGKVKGDLRECKEYNKFVDDLKPKALTLIFTNAYMSNPSSLFGHTLFRIDTKRKGTQLLAHGVNFGADTREDVGVEYAIKGLFGGYYGVFGISPYWDVINLYNNIENRDIWEYELDLNDEELEMFMAHIWEIKNAKIRYYFASQNCSYVLIKVLEAIKKEVNIAEKFKGYTVPLSLLKELNKIDGVIRNANYRPSRMSKLKFREKQMNDKQRKAFVKIIKNDEFDVEELEDGEKADVYETAYQYVQYRYVERELELKDYRKKSFKLLKERSLIKNQKLYFEELKEGENPIYAHEQREFSVGMGDENGDVFYEVKLKPLYNSLLSDSYGLLKGAEINVGEIGFRYWNEKNKLKLNSFDLLKIRSLAVDDVMFNPYSYDIKIGYEQKRENDENKGAFVLEIGVGKTYQIGQNGMMYLLSQPNMAYSSYLSENGYVGFGVKGGFYYNKEKLRFDMNVVQNYTTSKKQNGQKYEVSLGYGVTRNMMIFGEYKRYSVGENSDEFVGGIKFNW